ncbi:MAG: sugar ABC transporter permease [Candidatus Melainabacteria bacterium]|nr:sugar ABC transporter permease [Candidatus Melainabacteria bacterium]
MSKLFLLLAFLFPWLVGFFVFLLGPILASFYLSFTDYDILQKPVWIGFDNYKQLFNDPVFWKSLHVTFVYAFFALPLSVVFGISLAILLNQKIPGISIYRTCYYLPSIVPLVASSIVWLWIFRGDEGGLLNNFLSKININGPLWFSDPKWALAALIIMSLWSTGNSVLIYLAGLQDIPATLYEASDIDGAGFWQKLFFITLPMLMPTIFFNLIIGIISVFQYFIPAYVMTSGGPQYATTFYSLYAYQNAFEDFKFGYASAMSWILFLIVVFFTWLAFKGLSGKIFYQGK